MKVSISKKVRDKIKWALTVHHDGKRRRKFFDSAMEADKFDVISWLGDLSKKEPVGDMTILSCARDKYLIEYHENNYNPSKPKQKGYSTTEERVNKFLAWMGEDKPVSHVTVELYKQYVNSGRWSEKTKKEYGRAVRIFMAWCAKQGFGANVTDWYMQTNPELKMTTKKVFFKLPGILQVEEARALLKEIDEKYKPALAIMLFTGIRPEMEMATLMYSDIRWGKSIGLKAEHTKTGRERWVKPPENLWSWVPKSKGSVMPSYNALNLARRWASARGRVQLPTKWSQAFVWQLWVLEIV